MEYRYVIDTSAISKEELLKLMDIIRSKHKNFNHPIYNNFIYVNPRYFTSFHSMPGPFIHIKNINSNEEIEVLLLDLKEFKKQLFIHTHLKD